ncbi:MAG: phosphoribosylamine--glycine ligase, partial [Chthoniobacterales bacterium]
AFDGDKGPNTGGMGAISPADTWSGELQSQFDRAVMRPLLAGLTSRGIDFRGLLFPGLMINQRGPQVLEFNCRFGDPETQAILPRLRSDLLELMDATIDGELDRATSAWDDRLAVTVVLASGGYPEKYETGHEISGLEEAAKLSNVLIFHAGTQRKNGRVVTAGGRVLAVTALGDSTEVARRLAYEAVERISFEGCHFRRDVAASRAPINVVSD